MKKYNFVAILFALVAVFLMVPKPAEAETAVHLEIGSNIAVVENYDGWYETYLDAAPFVSNGRTMVPLRFIGEAFGADVVYEETQSGQEIVIYYGNITAGLLVGSYLANFTDDYGNYYDVDMGAVPQIVRGRVYVPLRFLAENLGYDVQYYNGIVTITSYY